MGQPMPDVPHEYDVQDCIRFDPGKTPLHLFIRFSLIEKCPAAPVYPPNDRMFTLTQVVDHPCYWRYDSADWGIGVDLNAAPDPTDILLLSGDENWAYFIEHHAQPIVEGRVYHNESVHCPLGRGGKNGICCITWTHQATELLEAINMQRAAKLFMELRPLEDGKLVYKFCRLQDGTNIAILFEPD